MKKAILYARVSTDRQAEQGHGREEQIARMRNYCQQNNIQVVREFLEDYSAKNFNRPAFTQILSELKSKALQTDLLIVPKIDRFTRNLKDTFAVVSQLEKYKVTVFSLAEGEMDFENPHRFFPLIIQTGAAEYDNMIRGQNVKRGMRQGMKKGHFMAKPPKGYKRDKETNLLVFDQPLAEVVQWAFQQYAKGIYSAEEVRRIAKERGLELQKQAFLNMLANVLYIGKILVPKTKEEPEEIVEGLHEPLIDEHTFYTVQSVLQGKRKPYKESKDSVSEALPLRGHLICPKCERTLTGSINQNRPNGNRIPYYHCQTKKYACNHRINAIGADKLFKEYLQTFQPTGEVVNLFKHVLDDIFNTNDADRLGRKKQVEAKMEDLKGRIENMDYKYADGGISDENYSRIIAKLTQVAS